MTDLDSRILDVFVDNEGLTINQIRARLADDKVTFLKLKNSLQRLIKSKKILVEFPVYEQIFYRL